MKHLCSALKTALSCRWAKLTDRPRASAAGHLILLSILMAAVFLSLLYGSGGAADAVAGELVSELRQDTSTEPYTKTLTNSEFGLVFVNSAETNSGTPRIQRGLDTGVRMDRFPVYWEQVERRYGQFTWTSQDTAIRANESLGMNTLAILLGTPRQYRVGGRSLATSLGGSFAQLPPGQAPLPIDCNPQEVGGECDLIEVTNFSEERLVGALVGEEAPYNPDLEAQASSCSREQGPPAPHGLWNPIFVNGTDESTTGTRLNPTNPWARFVGAAVQRYMPGGDAGTNIRHWEIWNEPDLCHFWSGTPREYARLLKVAYIVIKWVDPEAFVVFGGLAHFANGQWLYQMLDELKADTLSASYGGFFRRRGHPSLLAGIRGLPVHQPCAQSTGQPGLDGQADLDNGKRCAGLQRLPGTDLPQPLARHAQRAGFLYLAEYRLYAHGRRGTDFPFHAA